MQTFSRKFGVTPNYAFLVKKPTYNELNNFSNKNDNQTTNRYLRISSFVIYSIVRSFIESTYLIFPNLLFRCLSDCNCIKLKYGSNNNNPLMGWMCHLFRCHPLRDEDHHRGMCVQRGSLENSLLRQQVIGPNDYLVRRGPLHGGKIGCFEFRSNLPILTLNHIYVATFCFYATMRHRITCFSQNLIMGSDFSYITWNHQVYGSTLYNENNDGSSRSETSQIKCQ